MWTVDTQSFAVFLSEEMKRLGPLMNADQERCIWSYLIGDKQVVAARQQLALLASSSPLAEFPSPPSASSSVAVSTASAASPSSSVLSNVLTIPDMPHQIRRVTIHPHAIQDWLLEQSPDPGLQRMTFDTAPILPIPLRRAFFWSLLSMLHNRHQYGIQGTAAARVYESAHVPRGIHFPDSSARTHDLDSRLMQLKQTLFAHQRREVEWMASLERLIGRSPDDRRPVARMTHEDSQMPGLEGWFIHSGPKIADTVIDRVPPPKRLLSVAGGVLGSSVGTGKTISFMALVCVQQSWIERGWSRQARQTGYAAPAPVASSSSSSCGPVTSSLSAMEDIHAGSALPRLKATLVITPNQTFKQHVDKARATLPDAYVIVAVSTKEQYMATTTESILGATLVIVSLEFLANDFYSKTRTYLDQVASESPAKRQKREGRAPSKRDLLFARGWSLHDYIWARLVLDEAHELFQPQSPKRHYARHVFSLRSCFRWYVSATFPHASPDEMRGAMQFLELNVNGRNIRDCDDEFRLTSSKLAWLPSYDDEAQQTSVTHESSSASSPGRCSSRPLIIMKGSIMHTSTGAALRRFLYRDLYYRTTREQVQIENPHLNLFKDISHKLIVARSNFFERTIEGSTAAPYYGSHLSLLLFTSPEEFFPSVRMFRGQEDLVHAHIDRVCQLLQIIQKQINHPPALHTHRAYYHTQCFVHSNSEFALRWVVIRDDGCIVPDAPVCKCFDVFNPNGQRRHQVNWVDIYPDWTWSVTRWTRPTTVHNDGQTTTVRSQQFHTSAAAAVVPAAGQQAIPWYLRMEQQSLKDRLDQLDGFLDQFTKTSCITTMADQRLEGLRPMFQGGIQVVDTCSVMPEEWRTRIAAVVDGKVKRVLASSMMKMSDRFFPQARQLPSAIPLWIAQQTHMIATSLLVIHDILERDPINNRIVLFASDVTQLELLLHWLQVLMPHVNYVKGGRSIQSKTRAIASFERKEEEAKEDSILVSPAPAASASALTQTSLAPASASASSASTFISASSASSASSACSTSDGSASVRRAQLIVFTSTEGSSGSDLVAGNHLVILDTWNREDAAGRDAARRAFQQMVGRVDRVTQAQSVQVIRIISDKSDTFTQFADSL